MNDVFDDDYLLQLFKLCLQDIRHLEQLVPYLKYSYMPSEEYKSLWKAILTEYSLSDKKGPPSLGVLKMQFRKEPKVLALVAELRCMPKPDEDRVLSVLEEFIRQHMFVEHYEEIYSTYTAPGKGNVEKAYELYKKRSKEFEAFGLGTLPMERVFGDYEARSSQRAFDSMNEELVRLPTPFEGINHWTNGGGEPGEFWCYLGRSGDGKSYNLDAHAIRLARFGQKVALFKLEGTKRQNMDRLDSAWTGTLYYDVKENNMDPVKLNRLRKTIRNVKGSGGEIFVEVPEKFGAMTIGEIRRRVIELKRKYPDLKVVIIDYFELVGLGGEGRYGTDPAGEKARQQALGRAFKDLAVEQGVWVITATQVAEGSVPEELLKNPSFVMKRANLGADKDKVRPMDVFITQNRSPKDVQQKTCRLHIDKAREHRAGQTIHIVQDLAHSRFYDRVATIKKLGTDLSRDYQLEDQEEEEKNDKD